MVPGRGSAELRESLGVPWGYPTGYRDGGGSWWTDATSNCSWLQTVDGWTHQELSCIILCSCLVKRGQFIRRNMDACHRTGVFYQAMPAVGADGKNIMKLIPVQMVNGQFVQPRISLYKSHPTPQTAVTKDIPSAPVHMAKQAALNSPAPQQGVREQGSLLNESSNPADFSNSLNKQPLQQQTMNLMGKVPPLAALLTNCGQSTRPLSQLPVTVKSPALPRGQYLQIPPNAQVHTVPASQLPPGIKEHIFTSPPDSSLGAPSVVYVSPVTTVSQGIGPPGDSSCHSRPHKTQNKTLCGLPPKRVKPHLKLIPKVSQRPNSPTRWVIEEVDSSAALRPPSSPSVTSTILQAAAEREITGGQQHSLVQKTVSLDDGVQQPENALVVCNGKVFFVTKKHRMQLKPTTAPMSSELNATSDPPFSKLKSAAAQTHRAPGESDDVIDLCDDDSQENSPQQSAASHLDEDNVIFVSYIPPTSESRSAPHQRLNTRVAEEMDQTGSSSRGGEPGSSRGGEPGRSRGGEPGCSMSVTADVHVAVMDVNDGDSSEVKSQQSASTQQLDSLEVGPEKKSHNMQSSSDHTPGWTPPLVPKSCEVTDHLLRQMFGITADVKVVLQRIDDTAAESVPAESSRSVKEKDIFPPDLHSPPEPNIVPTEQDPSAPPLSGVTPPKCSHLKLNTKAPSASNQKCPSGQSSPNWTSCDTEIEPVIGYVEPIEEDFISVDGNNILTSQDSADCPQTCVDLSINIRRLGRMRKRPMCPCCVSSPLDPAVKSSTTLEKPETWGLTTEQVGKKGARTNNHGKDDRTSGRTSHPADKRKKKDHQALVRDSPSTAAKDSDELKRHELVKGLKELLRRKKAALKPIRNNVI